MIVFWLLVGHFVTDFVFQSEWIAKNKNHVLSPEYWPYALAAHAGAHAVMVKLVTGSDALAFLELCCHARIDYLKCAGVTTLDEDQMLHIACKCVWAVILHVAVLIGRVQ